MKSKPFDVVLKNIIATGPPGMTQEEIESAVARALQDRLMVSDHNSNGVQVPIVAGEGRLVMVDQVTVGLGLVKE